MQFGKCAKERNMPISNATKPPHGQLEMIRGSLVEGRRLHKPEIAGSIPAPVIWQGASRRETAQARMVLAHTTPG